MCMYILSKNVFFRYLEITGVCKSSGLHISVKTKFPTSAKYLKKPNVSERNAAIECMSYIKKTNFFFYKSKPVKAGSYLLPSTIRTKITCYVLTITRTIHEIHNEIARVPTSLKATTQSVLESSCCEYVFVAELLFRALAVCQSCFAPRAK